VNLQAVPTKSYEFVILATLCESGIFEFGSSSLNLEVAYEFVIIAT
jgi:hypothetical protein